MRDRVDTRIYCYGVGIFRELSSDEKRRAGLDTCPTHGETYFLTIILRVLLKSPALSV